MSLTDDPKLPAKPPGFLTRVENTYGQMIKRASDLVAGIGIGNSWFNPGQPYTPSGPPDAIGRALDYPTNYNINLQPRAYEIIGFGELRALAEYHDITRLMIETRKDQVEALEWSIRPIKDSKLNSNKKELLARAEATQEFLMYPDGMTPFAKWLRELVEDILVIDAPTIWVDRAEMGNTQFKVIDGATIKRVIDEDGRTPPPPSPAYQQIIKGMPAWNYTRDDLIYLPRNPRPGRLYGMSPVQQIIVTVNIALRKQASQLAYFTDGNIPDALISTPESWTPEQIIAYQKAWDALFEGQAAQKRHAKFVPGKVDLVQTKEAILHDSFDEWLLKIVAFAFSVTPSAFINNSGNRATAQTMKEAAQEEGLTPLLNHIACIINVVVQRHLGQFDLEFAWTEKEETGKSEQTALNDTKIRNGTKTINEARAEDGDDPVEGGDVPFIMTGSGPIPVASLVNLPLEPPPPPGTLPPGGDPGMMEEEEEPEEEGDPKAKDERGFPDADAINAYVDGKLKGKDTSGKVPAAAKARGFKADRPFGKASTGKIPLYVKRPVLNAGEIIEWARSQGFTETLLPEDLHVTQIYSHTPVHPETFGRHLNTLRVGPGRRKLERFNKGAVVLQFESFRLRSRWRQFIDGGCSCDFPDYKSHVTLSYGNADLNLDVIRPFQGVIVLGPEVFKEIKEDFDPASLVEKGTGTFDESQHPRHPAGSRLGGKFAPKGGAFGPRGVVFYSEVDRAVLAKVFPGDPNAKAKIERMMQEMVAQLPPSVPGGYVGRGFVKSTSSAANPEIGFTISGHAEGEDDADDTAVYLQRYFRHDAAGDLIVKHDTFELGSALQGKGIGARVLGAALPGYDALGVKRIELLANLDVGGYAWAKAGFHPVDYYPRNLRENLNDFSPRLSAMSHDWDNDDLTYNLATKAGKDGKDFLLKSDWRGHMDLTNPKQRKRYEDFVGGQLGKAEQPRVRKGVKVVYEVCDTRPTGEYIDGSAELLGEPGLVARKVLKAYSPDQLRAPAGTREGGRWIPQGAVAVPSEEMPEEVYHGTAKHYLDSIRETGIRPMQHHNFGEHYYSGERGEVAFATDSYSVARQYADKANGFREAKNHVILRIKVPKDAVLAYDDKSYDSFMVGGGIPPEWITGYKLGSDSRWGGWRSLEKQAGRTFYLVILTDEDGEEAEKAFNPKGTEEGGQWTSTGIGGDRQDQARALFSKERLLAGQSNEALYAMDILLGKRRASKEARAEIDALIKGSSVADALVCLETKAGWEAFWFQDYLEYNAAASILESSPRMPKEALDEQKYQVSDAFAEQRGGARQKPLTEGQLKAYASRLQFHQDRFRKLYGDEGVVLYRGVSGKHAKGLEVGSEVSAGTYTLSSWSTSRADAVAFANAGGERGGKVMEMRAKPEDVWMIPTYGVRVFYGEKAANREVVLANKKRTRVVRVTKP